jgi:hypothetical protein
MPALPFIKIGSLSVSRLIVGGNPFSGISHQDGQADAKMVDYYTVERIKAVLAECERAGINCWIARADNFISRVLREYRNGGGRILWIAQSAPERKSLLDNIQMARARGADGFFVQGAHTNEIPATWTWAEFADAVKLIRDLGMPAGAASHSPTFHAERLGRGISLDFACQCLYRLAGRMGNIHAHIDQNERFVAEDRAVALDAITKIPEPVIAYKIMGAGRCQPREAFREVGQFLKPKDGACVGIYNEHKPDMVAENVRLALEFFK